ncbi:coronin-1C-A-like [Dendronephthya gigantea]|uniref:coronin-1C-A-like n=1 Tax=Dendronephthya gigantea TaxID=151771 RepID=UPI00106AD21D|nr:coronin-1C-A-like [Dendronephthya gigantea]
MPNFVRSSKFRHVFGTGSKREHCYDGMKVSKNSWEAPYCAVNPKFVAIVLDSAGGGSFLVLPLEKVGRVDLNAPKVAGHKQEVLDIAWCPFNDNLIASSSEDATVKIWQIPDGGLVENLTHPLLTLEGVHQRRIGHVVWNPVAENILLSASHDNVVAIWNLESGQAIRVIECHQDLIYSISWNHNGSKIATTCKDKKLRIIDAHSGEVLQEGKCHEGAKPQRVVFCSNMGFLFTTGFTRMSKRVWAIWDEKNLEKPLHQDELDSSNGVNFPYYDPDTKMVYLVGKGDSVIRYYELVSEAPYCHYLSTYQSSDPQKGCGFMPKRGCNVNQNEVTRFFKIHSTKPLCEPISFTVPRKSELFQKDIFPETASDEPALTAEEWEAGKNAEPKTISLEAGFKPREKGGTSIGTKNVMAGVSSRKLDKSDSSASQNADVQSLINDVKALKEKVEQNEKKIAQLEEEVKELKEK